MPSKPSLYFRSSVNSRKLHAWSFWLLFLFHFFPFLIFRKSPITTSFTFDFTQSSTIAFVCACNTCFICLVFFFDNSDNCLLHFFLLSDWLITILCTFAISLLKYLCMERMPLPEYMFAFPFSFTVVAILIIPKSIAITCPSSFGFGSSTLYTRFAYPFVISTLTIFSCVMFTPSCAW